MTLIATQINYYHLCHRKLWLFSNGINMEHTSDTVYEGKLLGETTYPQRAERYRELLIDGVKIDFYDPYDKVVHEIKKSDKVEEAHIAQVKYYLYILEKNGIPGAKGILEYPKLRRREEVKLLPGDVELILNWETEIKRIIESEQCPRAIVKKICKNCSYFDFCYIGEEG
jgi:CRISPR-associated exonuclease Cas4